MSDTHFRREWQRVFGETSMGYRDRARISFAKEYLQSGYYNVSEVAEKCGFSDVSYFVRFFKKREGITPKEFSRLSMDKRTELDESRMLPNENSIQRASSHRFLRHKHSPRRKR